MSSVTGLTLAVRGMRREDGAARLPSLSLAPCPPDTLADRVPNVGPAEAVDAREPHFRNPSTY